MNGGPDFVTQFDMPRNEVGMKVGEEDVFDGIATGCRIREVLIDVPLGIDHDGSFCFFVRYHV
jgi:hypothetical protein